MPNLTAVRARLRAMLAKATPGPWIHGDTTSPVRYREENLAVSFSEEEAKRFVIYRVNECCSHEHDAALIAECRNALPALLDRLDALKVQLRRIIAKCSECHGRGYIGASGNLSCQLCGDARALLETRT